MEKKPIDHSAKVACDARLVMSKTLPECSSVSLEPHGMHGPLVVKIPVVISEPKIQIDVESEIRLEEPAIEIKRIKKNIFLTQCKLICIWEPKDEHEEKPEERYIKPGCKEEEKEEECKWGKLFLKGFVRKNIEYSTLRSKCSEKDCISGEIRHTTCNIPFECVTKVHFAQKPIFKKSGITAEVEIFSTKFNICDPCSEPILGRNPCEQDFRHFEAFTEKVFCELESAKIFEEDIHMAITPLDRDCTFEHVFDTFTEKMVIFLKLKLLQNQQVKIPEEHKMIDYGPYGSAIRQE